MTVTCKDCGYISNTLSSLCYHRREKHTHNACVIKVCNLCENNFYSPENYKQLKCQECRDLQQSLHTNDLVYGTYVYDQKKRYYVNKGFVTEVCAVYDCSNDQNCHHMTLNLTTCRGSKCSKMFLHNSFNFCDMCRSRSHASKQKRRNKVLDLKKQLGGKCVDCGTETLYILEFDHIDPTRKKKQITRMAPTEWHKEIDNIALRCGNCHRLKSYQEMLAKHTDAPKCRKKTYNAKIMVQTHNLKKEIGGCQICGWTDDNITNLGVVLEFDHINDNKVDQVSLLVPLKSKLQEIIKCRCICRACHQVTTAMQRGGVSLQLQMSPEEYQELYNKYMSRERCMEMNKQVFDITKRLFEAEYPEVFETLE